MKKLLLIIGLFLSVSSFSQKIKTSSSLEFGYYRLENMVTYYTENKFKHMTDPLNFYSDFNVVFNYKKLYVDNSLITSFGKSQDIYFSPNQAEYTIKIFIKFDKVSFGFDHMCSHPIINKKKNKTQFRGFYDKLYIKINL